LSPDAVAILLNEFDAQLGDVGRNKRLAGKDRMKAQRAIEPNFNVLLPRSRVAFPDDRPPAAIVRHWRHRLLPLAGEWHRDAQDPHGSVLGFGNALAQLVRIPAVIGALADNLAIFGAERGQHV